MLHRTEFNLSLKLAVLAAATTLGSAVLLSEMYRLLGSLFSSAWVSAATVNTVLTILIFIWLGAKQSLKDLLSFSTVDPEAPKFFLNYPLFAFVPSILIIVGVTLLIVISRLISGTENWGNFSTPISWLLWIPFVEESVFRVGLGGVFRKLYGGLWGSWFSAGLFSLAHSTPTFSSILTGDLGLPIGPFLLGLCCEILFRLTKRLWPIVTFHAACNATVAAFSVGDERWLDWLDFLYG